MNLFSGINISVEKGEIYGIIGTNGSGKTTIFNIITGVLKPDAGQVVFNGKDITGYPTWRIARMGIGRCFQLVQPFMSMTPIENVRVARATAGACSDGIHMSIDEIMDITGLNEKKDLPISELSLPDKKNVEIARALACRPKIILFDEVSCGLSGEEIGDRMKMMKRLAEKGVAVIVIEHIMMFIKEICDEVAVLHAGDLIAKGTPDEIIKDDRVIQAYLGGNVI